MSMKTLGAGVILPEYQHPSSQSIYSITDDKDIFRRSTGGKHEIRRQRIVEEPGRRGFPGSISSSRYRERCDTPLVGCRN